MKKACKHLELTLSAYSCSFSMSFLLMYPEIRGGNYSSAQENKQQMENCTETFLQFPNFTRTGKMPHKQKIY